MAADAPPPPGEPPPGPPPQPPLSAPPERTFFYLDAPYQVSRLRVLFNWLLALPLYVLSWIIGQAMVAVWMFSIITVLFKRQMPVFAYNFLLLAGRYRERVGSFAFFYLPKWPRLEFPDDPIDPRTYPAQINYPARREEIPRYAIFNYFLLFPHYVWMLLLFVVFFLPMIAVFLMTLATGSYPKGFRNLMVKMTTYMRRVSMYTVMVEPLYPNFDFWSPDYQ